MKVPHSPVRRSPLRSRRGIGIALLLVFGAFWSWQTPGWVRGALTPEEVDYHIGMLEQNLVMPGAEKAELLARLRAWAMADGSATETPTISVTTKPRARVGPSTSLTRSSQRLTSALRPLFDSSIGCPSAGPGSTMI